MYSRGKSNNNNNNIYNNNNNLDTDESDLHKRPRVSGTIAALGLGYFGFRREQCVKDSELLRHRMLDWGV
jgi:hypothetical protein